MTDFAFRSSQSNKNWHENFNQRSDYLDKSSPDAKAARKKILSRMQKDRVVSDMLDNAK